MQCHPVWVVFTVDPPYRITNNRSLFAQPITALPDARSGSSNDGRETLEIFCECSADHCTATELHPAVADLDPRLRPLSKRHFDLAGIDIVVNTHLHFDHCGGNHLFAGRPIYVQRRELDDARSEDDYTIREWVEAPGVRYVPVDGELELLPGLRLVPAPGHTRGMQVVAVATQRSPRLE